MIQTDPRVGLRAETYIISSDLGFGNNISTLSLSYLRVLVSFFPMSLCCLIHQSCFTVSPPGICAKRPRTLAEHHQSSRLSIRHSCQTQVARGNFRVLKWGFPFSKSRLTVHLGVGLDCSILSWLVALRKDFESLTALFFHRGIEA